MLKNTLFATTALLLGLSSVTFAQTTPPPTPAQSSEGNVAVKKAQGSEGNVAVKKAQGSEGNVAVKKAQGSEGNVAVKKASPDAAAGTVKQ
jgi:hypothetical protein